MNKAGKINNSKGGFNPFILALLLAVLLAGCNSINSGNENPSGSLPPNADSAQADSAQANSAPNTLLPQIMVDGAIYYLNSDYNSDISIDENSYSGYVMSTVPLSQIPTVNGQANFNVLIGSPYAKYENGIAVLWNDKWTSFTVNDGKTGSVDKVYFFNGGNEYIEIKNGEIILTPKLEMFIGGDLSFPGGEPQNIKSYTEKYYFYLNSVETDICSTTGMDERSEGGLIIAPGTSSTSAEKLFNSDEIWDIVTAPGALHFSLSGTFVNGETFAYDIVLSVNEAQGG